MKLTSEEVKKVAKLANLPITPDQEEKYSEQLSKILGYIEKLDQADTEGVEPLYNVSPNRSVLRSDEVRESLTQEESLQNGKNVRQGYFVTKGVFEEE